MLKKLRNKIVLTNLLFVGILLIAVSVGLCVYIANSAIGKMQNRLELAIKYVVEFPDQDFTRSFGFAPGERKTGWEGTAIEGETPPPIPDIESLPQGKIRGNRQTIDGAAFSVLLDADGNVISKKEFFASMDDDSLEYALAYVESSGSDTGSVKALDLEYKKLETALGTAVAFTSRTDTVSTVTSAIIIAASVDAVIMLFIAFISFRLASLSMKPVQEAWDSQKRFIADASHELKTPLTVILANNSILEANVRDGKTLQWIDSTRYEAERMQKLIEEMLFLAKSDEGGYKMSLGEVDISETAEQCCLSFEPVAFDQNVFIDTEIEPDVMLTTDLSMVEKVFGVLLDNAVKHSEKGGSVLFSLSSDVRSVRISVSNKGEPIPEENIEHVFERFYKAESSRTADSAKSGFGLGLAIAHDIVEKLGGSISVRSTAEEGTVFTVVLKKV